MDLEDADRRLREIVAKIPSQVRPVLLEVLTPDEERRAAEIVNLHASEVMPTTAELLIDCEEDAALRAVLVGILREASR